MATDQIKVLLFAGLSEQAGWREQSLLLSKHSTPASIWQQLKLGPPGAMPAQVRIAINQQFAKTNTPLRHGDELAFMPAISGG
ncbi:MAG: MoaD/ThiS family protein [Cyanobacteria bacterium]|nr:MoaD/ThiS family protein [Cyanobacteriota bacterium]MDA1169956.1 MoaD/ThiS family protein [Cyanobacteriota bacterium]